MNVLNKYDDLADLINNLLTAKETNVLEFKTSKDSLPKSFWETYSAFANTQGGYIILGVEENSPNIVVGVNNADKIKKELFSLANNKGKVSHNLIEENNVCEHIIDGKTVISVYIPELSAHYKPLYLNDNLKNSYIRKNEGDYKVSSEDLRRFIRDSHDEDIDSELLDEEKYNIDDLNPNSVLMFKNIINKREPSKHFLEISDLEFLKTMGVFRSDRDDGKKLKLTLAGLIFLGKFESISYRIPHFHLEYINKRGKNVARWIDRVSTGGIEDFNLFEFHRIVLEKLRLTVEESFDLDVMSVRKPESELNIALREALTNMIVHADYLDSNNTIKVEVDNLYYTFSNPGRMKVSKSQFFSGGQSIPRNHILFQFFRRMGYCERVGTGGKEIANVYKNINKYRFPDLEIASDHTNLKLWCAIPAETYPDLSSYAQKVFKFMNKNGNFKKNDIIKGTQLSEYYVKTAIKELKDKNLITTHGKGPATVYFCSISKIEQLDIADKFRDLVMNS